MNIYKEGASQGLDYIEQDIFLEPKYFHCVPDESWFLITDIQDMVSNVLILVL